MLDAFPQVRGRGSSDFKDSPGTTFISLDKKSKGSQEKLREKIGRNLEPIGAKRNLGLPKHQTQANTSGRVVALPGC